MNKQIEEMAKDLCEAEFWEFSEESNDLELNREETVKNLYDIGYRKQPEWISVEERLPENYEKHLLLLDDGRITIGWYHEGAMKFVEDGFVIVNIVTHWMPLPMPPKGDVGNENNTKVAR